MTSFKSLFKVFNCFVVANGSFEGDIDTLRLADDYGGERLVKRCTQKQSLPSKPKSPHDQAP